MFKKYPFSQFKSLILDKKESNFDIPGLVKSVYKLLHNRFLSKRNIFKTKKEPNDLTKKDSFPLGPIPRKEVMKGVVDAFNGMIRWGHPYVMHNVTPPVLKDAIAVRNLVNIYNPNCLWDFVSGDILNYEKQIGKQMAGLFGWNPGGTGIIFTFGGKATLLYAIRAGINRCERDSVSSGLSGDVVVLTSENTHYSIEYACILLGLGRNNCIRIKNDQEGNFDLVELQNTILDLNRKNKKIGAIILSGGNSLDLKIDPVSKTVELIDKLERELKLDYRPYIHFDTVIGWAWLSFSDYDFTKNPLNLSHTTNERIKLTLEVISGIKYADSAGVDYHKTGLCPYITSAFVIKDKTELLSLNHDSLIKEDIPQTKGQIFTQHYTIEHSRSAEGILSAWVSIHELGIQGYQRYIGTLMDIRALLERYIDRDEFILLNSNKGLGFALVIQPSVPESASTQKTYVKRLFEFFNDNAQNTDWAPVIGFVPEYKAESESTPVSALKLYPMYPLTSEKDIKRFLSMLCRVKNSFDIKYKEVADITLDEEKDQQKYMIVPK